MTDDPRCCGSGTCIIDPEGHCWCGQQWDGKKMAAPQHGAESERPASAEANAATNDATSDKTDEGTTRESLA